MRFAKAYVEITNCCNRSCAFCPGTLRKPRFMTVEEFRLIAERLRPATDFLYFHVMGEPLLHPELETLLEQSAILGFRVILTTNGTLLSRVGSVLLSAQALHKVNISLHSFEANADAQLPELLSECTDFAARAAERGILINLRLWNLDGENTNGLNKRNGEILTRLESYFPKPWKESRGGFRLAPRVYLNYAERFAWPSLRAEDFGERRYCYALQDQLGVLCDGTVVPCCLDHEGDIPLGNLLLQPLEEILASPRAAAISEGFRQGRATEELCRRCGYSTRFRLRGGAD